MEFLHYIEAILAAVGALGTLCSALSRVTSGKTSDVLAHLGTNFIQAAREVRRPDPESPKHIRIPGSEP